MNYYKQGDAANADKIKAAFEKLGYDTTGWKFNVEGGFYYTTERKRIDLGCGNFLINLIKTHPDYQELELPVEHNFKFKVGDWIVQNDNGTVSQITKVINDTDEYGEYRAYEHTNGYFAACFENEYHLWTIQDAKDGDVLATDNGWTCIFKAFDGCVFSSYCFMDSQNWFCEFGSEAHTPDSRLNGNIHPATKEQRDLLFKKMKEAGYTWDGEKKELNKIQTHYDISNFQPKQWVLVRQGDGCAWRLDIFSNLKEGAVCQFECVGNSMVQCIPFDGNENLLGTTDPCDEQYINW